MKRIVLKNPNPVAKEILEVLKAGESYHGESVASLIRGHANDVWGLEAKPGLSHGGLSVEMPGYKPNIYIHDIGGGDYAVYTGNDSKSGAVVNKNVLPAVVAARITNY